MHAMKPTMDRDTWCPNQNVVGVIGGMGPGATVKLFQYVFELQKATSDEDHVPLLIYNNPQIPNNNKAVLQTGPSSVPAMGYTARALERPTWLFRATLHIAFYLSWPNGRTYRFSI